MNGAVLDRVFRAAGGRIISVLAARFRGLDVAEDAFAEACARAVRVWPQRGAPADPAAWLYKVAERVALDALRQRRPCGDAPPDRVSPEPNAEELMLDDRRVVPDERLRLIFICCHPAVAAESRAALTLRLVCGLTTTEIARAFLVAEATLAQRLVRAKRKIAEAGVPFELPEPKYWPERLESVLLTLEVAYSKAHEDAAGHGPNVGFASEVLRLTRMLTELLPNIGEPYALAATVHYAEARRPARVDTEGMMIPLADQDPMRWRRDLITQADHLLARATELAAASPRTIQAAIHGTWCARGSLSDPAPWRRVLKLYDSLLAQRDDLVVRINRIVAVAEVQGPGQAFAELAALGHDRLADFPPYVAVSAHLSMRLGRRSEALSAYSALLQLNPSSAERLWIERRMDGLGARSSEAERGGSGSPESLPADRRPTVPPSPFAGGTAGR